MCAVGRIDIIRMHVWESRGVPSRKIVSAESGNFWRNYRVVRPVLEPGLPRPVLEPGLIRKYLNQNTVVCEQFDKNKFRDI